MGRQRRQMWRMRRRQRTRTIRRCSEQRWRRPRRYSPQSHPTHCDGEGRDGVSRKQSGSKHSKLPCQRATKSRWHRAKRAETESTIDTTAGKYNPCRPLDGWKALAARWAGPGRAGWGRAGVGEHLRTDRSPRYLQRCSPVKIARSLRFLAKVRCRRSSVVVATISTKS